MKTIVTGLDNSPRETLQIANKPIPAPFPLDQLYDGDGTDTLIGGAGFDWISTGEKFATILVVDDVEVVEWRQAA